MARDNAVEFTELKYTSRKEMGNELGIQVPDEMWKKVTNYRSTFNCTLSLKDTDNRNLVLCLYPTFAGKCKQVEEKLKKLVNENEALGEITGDKQHYRLTLQANCLIMLAELNKISIEEARIKKLITSENPFDDGEEKLLNYLSAMEFIEEHYKDKIDDNYLSELYSKVTGISELTYFYRENDMTDFPSIAIVGRTYNKAPARLIEQMMDMLFAFTESNNVSALSKALITYYYVLYVWPFRDYNQEIALLMAKSIFAHYSMSGLGALAPIEKLALEKDNYISKILNDVRLTADVTYFVSPLINVFEKAIDEVIDFLKEYTATEIRNDFYREEKEIKAEPVEEKPVEKEQVEEPIIEEHIFEENGVPQPEGYSVEEEMREEHAPAPIIPESSKEEIEKAPEKAELAVSYIPQEIDEKAAKRLENHLLELDVRLKKGEAYFYARHCTIGMYYTIEQYRKALKCVYETARTSMDHLAELGYYKKTKYGKKFVYTPIKRK